jgi:hypothetical protein
LHQKHQLFAASGGDDLPEMPRSSHVLRGAAKKPRLVTGQLNRGLSPASARLFFGGPRLRASAKRRNAGSRFAIAALTKAVGISVVRRQLVSYPQSHAQTSTGDTTWTIPRTAKHHKSTWHRSKRASQQDLVCSFGALLLLMPAVAALCATTFFSVSNVADSLVWYADLFILH